MKEVPAYRIGESHTLFINFDDQEIALMEENEDGSEDAVILTMPILQGVLTVLQTLLDKDGKLVRSEGLYVQ